MSEVVYLSESEREAIEALAAHLPEPGTRCPACHRRINKPRQNDSPEVREVRLRGPADLVESVEDLFDTLQEYTGVDPYTYPRIKLVEALLVLGVQQREQIKAHFEGTE